MNMGKKVFTILLLIALFSKVNAQDYVPFLKDSLWGLATWEGEVVFEPKWAEPRTTYVSSMHEYGFFVFRTMNGKIELVHGPSKKTFDQLIQIERLENSGLKCRKGKYYGLIAKNGETIIPFDFENIRQNRVSGHYILSKDYLSRSLFQEGDTLPKSFPYQHLRSLYFTDSSQIGFIGEKGNKWGYLNEKLEAIIPFEFDVLVPLTLYGGNKVLFFKAKKTNNADVGLFSLIDHQGVEILEAKYIDIKAYSRDVIAVSKKTNTGWQLLSSDGDVISSDSLRRVKFIPKRGTNPIDLIEVYDKFGKTIYYDTKGIEIELSKAEELIEASRKAEENIKINSLGEIVSKSGKKGFVSNNGDTILEVKYDAIRMLGNCFVTLDKTKPSHARQELHSMDGKHLGVSGRTASKIFLEPSSKQFPMIEFTTLLPSYMRGTEDDVPYQAFYRKTDGSQLLDGDFEEIYPELVRDDSTGNFQLIIKAKKNNLWGYWSENGEQIIDPKYDNIKPLIGSELFLVTLNGEQFVVNSEGKSYR